MSVPQIMKTDMYIHTSWFSVHHLFGVYYDWFDVHFMFGVYIVEDPRGMNTNTLHACMCTIHVIIHCEWKKKPFYFLHSFYKC